jgi:Holliday junction resolvase RusA-like endonuclease
VTFTAIIYGSPRTKKTSNRIVRVGGRPLILPSEAHEEWYARAFPQARYAFVMHRKRCALPLAEPVNVRALFFRDARRGDTTGYYQALADLLERAGILKNDKFIASWDGSRLLVDRDNPRIEVVMEKARQ